jgi:peptidoglycan/LPS O-acetylase OafA/YrhL
LGYRPALDGLRGVAILLVIPFDLKWGVTSGYIGVDLFFVLSGFLITVLLLEEHQRSGRVSLRSFYVRRVLRLLPALSALLLFIVVVSTVAFSPQIAHEYYVAALAALLFVANWVMALDPDGIGAYMRVLGPTWSLGVEEQFYFVWPAVLSVMLAFGAGARTLAWTAGAGIVASAVWRVVLSMEGVPPLRIYCGSDTRADALLIGCLVGIVVNRAHFSSPRLDTWLPIVGLGSLAAFIIGGFTLPSDASFTMQRGGFTLLAAIAACLIVSVVMIPRSGLTRALSATWLVAIGRVSYALYLWHLPIGAMVTAERVGLSGVALATVQVLVLAVVVTASWYVVERPALRLKRRWAKA